MMSFDYAAPDSVEEIVDLLERNGDDAHLIAGGASVVLLLRQQLISPRLLIGLHRSGLPRTIRLTSDGGLEIGALARHRDVERSEAVRAFDPGLAAAFGRIATIRVRNQGTVGGNLAHADPAQDPPPVLLVLDAVVRVRGPGGERTIPIGELFVDFYETSLEPSEVITSVLLPPRPTGARLEYLKYLPRTEDDYATVGVAVSGRTDGGRWQDVRLAIGAAAPVPLRVAAAESALEGADTADPEPVQRAAELVADSVDPISDVRGSADYKREMARVWTGRALRRLAPNGTTAEDR